MSRQLLQFYARHLIHIVLAKIIISMSFSQYSPVGRVCAGVRARVCVCVIVKRPKLPPCAVDGRSRNPLYHYYIHCYTLSRKAI